MTFPRLLKATAATCLYRSGLLSLRRALVEKGRAVLLMYHRVNDHRDPFFPSLERAVFARQLDFLKRHYRVDSLENVMEWMASGARGRSRVVITIDDGYEDTYDVVRPELSKRGLTASVFLSTSPIETGVALWTDRLRHAVKNATRDELHLAPVGLAAPGGGSSLALEGTPSRLATLRWLMGELKERQPGEIEGAVDAIASALSPKGPPPATLGWSQVRHMADTCFSIGAHTHRHYLLSRLEDADVESEIRMSVELLRERTQRPVSIFCYPNGRKRDYDARSMAVLRSLGVRYAVCAEGGFVEPGYDPLALPRLYTSERDLALFAARLSGIGRAQTLEGSSSGVATVKWTDLKRPTGGLERR